MQLTFIRHNSFTSQQDQMLNLILLISLNFFLEIFI